MLASLPLSCSFNGEERAAPADNLLETVYEILQTGLFQGKVAASTEGSGGGGAGQCPERGLAELQWGPLVELWVHQVDWQECSARLGVWMLHVAREEP